MKKNRIRVEPSQVKIEKRKTARTQKPLRAEKAKTVKIKKNSNILRLLKYCKKNAFALIIVVLLSILSVSLTVFGTTHLKTLTNYISNAANAVTENPALPMSDVLSMGYVIRLCCILGGMYLSSALCNFMQTFIMSSVNQRVAKRLRTDISQKINRLKVSYYDCHAVGDTMSRVTNDIDTVAQSLNSAISTTVSAVLQIVLVVIVMFVTKWELTLTALATVPLTFVIMLVVVKFSQKYFHRQQKRLGALNAVAEESYAGLDVIRAYCAEKQTAEKFERANATLKKTMFRANVLSGVTHPLTTFVSKLGYVAICVVGGILVANGDADLGTLAAFLIYVNLFQSPLGQLGQITNVIQTASAAAGRVFEFLDEDEQSCEDDKQIAILHNNVLGRVEFKNVCFGYDPDKPIIHDFNAVVEPGQKVAIVGPTGAGKTTLVNLLMRFYEVSSGEILIDGVPITAMKRETVRALFAMVLQDTWLTSGSAKENIAYAQSEIDEERLKGTKKAADLDYYIGSLPDGDETYILDEDLSSGQKQLLTIARAMYKNAPMMILDEATSSVDTRTEQSVQSAMDKLTEGCTSFVIAHRLSTIKNADMIFVLNDGEIVEQGSHNRLLAQGGFYSKLYFSQFGLNE